MSFKIGAMTNAALAAAATPTPPGGIPEEEEYYSSWSLFLVCMLLILSLLTSYYLQIKRIRAIHETLVSIFAGMVVGAMIRLAPGTMIREMLVSTNSLPYERLVALPLARAATTACNWKHIQTFVRRNGLLLSVAKKLAFSIPLPFSMTKSERNLLDFQAYPILQSITSPDHSELRL